jgi:hypothetical protein
MENNKVMAHIFQNCDLYVKAVTGEGGFTIEKGHGKPGLEITGGGPGGCVLVVFLT